MSIFSFLVNLFNALFKATKRAWEHLPKSVQDAILSGSGVFNILGQFIGQDPKLTIATIQANFPTLDLNELYAGLSAVARLRGLSVPPTLEGLIPILQDHLQKLDTKDWARTISGNAQVLADVLSGSETPFEAIVTVIQWVYTNKIKDKEIKLVAAPETM